MDTHEIFQRIGQKTWRQTLSTNKNKRITVSQANTSLLSICMLFSLWMTPSAQASTLGDLAASMPAGSFVEVPMTWPGGNPENILKHDAGNSFQYGHNGVWDPVSRQLLCKCGAHNHGGDLLIYNEAANSWKNGANPFGGHSYNHNAFSEGGSGYLYTGRFGERRDFWRYTVATNTWKQMPNADYPGSTGVARAYAWFPELDGGSIFLMDARKGYGAYFKESTGTWHSVDTSLYQSTSPLGLYHNIAQYNPKHKLVLFGGGNGGTITGSSKLYTLDSSGVVKQKSDAPFPLRVPSSNSPGGILLADPVSGKYILWHQSGKFYEYDVIADTWTELSNLSIPADMATSSNAARNALGIPISTHGVILYIKYLGKNTKAWLYKHAAGSGSPVPPPPPTPSVTSSPPSAATPSATIFSSIGWRY